MVVQPFKIAVSGAADGDFDESIKELARDVGRQIALHHFILLTGATTGIPQFAAEGAKQEKGMVIGFSPASSKREHMNKFRLPTEKHDIIFYSNFGNIFYQLINVFLSNIRHYRSYENPCVNIVFSKYS